MIQQNYNNHQIGIINNINYFNLYNFRVILSLVQQDRAEF